MSRPKSVDIPRVTGSVDSHCHLAIIQAKGVDVRALLDDLFASGMQWILDVGVDLETIPARKKLAAGFPRVLKSHGLYPSVAEDDALEQQLRLLEEHCTREQPVAIGEIGLDFHRGYATPDRQRDLFQQQLDLARRLSLPVVIHNREADSELLEDLSAARLDPTGVMHCFSGDIHHARRCLEAGYYISFAGNVTFRNAEQLREVARFVPADRLLLETDAPYLAPDPLRGRVNHPGLVNFTYRRVAELRGVSVEELARAVRDNFVRLFAVAEDFSP